MISCVNFTLPNKLVKYRCAPTHTRCNNVNLRVMNWLYILVMCVCLYVWITSSISQNMDQDKRLSHDLWSVAVHMVPILNDWSWSSRRPYIQSSLWMQVPQKLALQEQYRWLQFGFSSYVIFSSKWTGPRLLAVLAPTPSVPNCRLFDFFNLKFDHSSYSKICAKPFFCCGLLY